MQNRIKVNELSSFLNKEIITEFLVTQKELREGSKDFYLRLKLADNTGSIMGNIWNNARSISEKFQVGDVIKVKGIIISYKSQLQVTVNKIQKLEPEAYDLSDFIEQTSKDVDKLLAKLFQYIDSINDEDYKSLLLAFFDDKELLTQFSQAPAAKSWHHNYLGGLLEHTIAVTNICNLLAGNYPVERDLLVTGALLHDIGKILEYSVTAAIEFTSTGRLLGHIPLGDNMVCERAAQLNAFPPEKLMKLRHLILSHHGEYEKASARLPQTIEAIMLHHADNLDAQTTGVAQLIQAVQNPDAKWSEYDKLNNRYYYLK